jgi:hypothetical protein
MNYFRFASLLAITAATVTGQSPAGWKMLHDKTNSCMVSVPADWTVSAGSPWMANAPKDDGDIQIVSSAGRTVKPFNEMAQKALMVDKMFDNTPQRVFFSNPATKSDKPLTPYHVTVPGKGGTCTALISARPGLSEETVKKIAATLSAAH